MNEPNVLFKIHLRDQFAGLAMQAIMACPHYDPEKTIVSVCEDAYHIADAMMEHRKREKKDE